MHPNLPIFVGYSLSPSPRVVWERIGGPNLESFFRSQRAGDEGWRPKEKRALSWSKQLFSALACLHSDGLMHRDVKPGNILIKPDRKTVTLIDFGICRSVSSQAGDRRPLSGQTGSFRYMAPEIAAEQSVYEYESKVDVYSGAMCTWFMHTGEVPFSNLPGQQVAELAHRVSLRPSAASVKNERQEQALRASVKRSRQEGDLSPNLASGGRIKSKLGVNYVSCFSLSRQLVASTQGAR